MTDEWAERYASRTDLPRKLKSNLTIHLFGPYTGDCSYILGDIAEALREEFYNAKVCYELTQLPALSEVEEGDVYNWQASLECIRQADTAVFLFLEAKDRRFDGDIPQDINSSVILEFAEWSNQSPRGDDCFVIYENEMEQEIGSLIRGVVEEGTIENRKVTTTDRKDTVESMTDAISGQSRIWLNRFEPMLKDRMRGS